MFTAAGSNDRIDDPEQTFRLHMPIHAPIRWADYGELILRDTHLHPRSDRGRNMLHWLSLFCLLAMASSFSIGPADAQEQLIGGDWQQIESNAGACPKCQILIAPKGEALSVVSNNGWAAVVGIQRTSEPLEATGTGTWAPGRIGTTAGRPFNVVFRLTGQRLHMSMRVEMEDGSRRHIKAVFGRVWFGA